MTEEASVDSDERADEAWLLGVQRKLYQWSRNNPDGCYRELWNWVTDLRNLRCAWRKIASNQRQSDRRDRRDDGVEDSAR